MPTAKYLWNASVSDWKHIGYMPPSLHNFFLWITFQVLLRTHSIQKRFLIHNSSGAANWFKLMHITTIPFITVVGQWMFFIWFITGCSFWSLNSWKWSLKEDAASFWNVAHVWCWVITNGIRKVEINAVAVACLWISCMTARLSVKFDVDNIWWNGIAQDKTGSPSGRSCRQDHAMLRLQRQDYMDRIKQDKIKQDKIIQDNKRRWRLLKCLFSVTNVAKYP